MGINLQAASELVGLLTFGVVVIGLWAAWRRFSSAPRFIVGITPTKVETIGGDINNESVLEGPQSARQQGKVALSELGTPAPLDEFRHDGSAFALPVGKLMGWRLLGRVPLVHLLMDHVGDRKAYRGRRAWNAFDRIIQGMSNDRKRRRTIQVGDDGHCVLPIMISNVGSWTAVDYHFTIRFGSDAIRIFDLATETLEIDTVYRAAPASGSPLEESISDVRISQAYEGYLQIERASDYLFLKGTLESQTYELIVLELWVQERIDFFGAIFRINSPLPYPKVSGFVQRVDLVWPRSGSVL